MRKGRRHARVKRTARSYLGDLRGSKSSTTWVVDLARPSSLASRGRTDCKRFAQTARPGSEKAWLLELFFAIGGFFGIIFGSLLEYRMHFGRVGGPLVLSKRNGLGHRRSPRRHRPQKWFHFWDLSENDLFNIRWFSWGMLLGIVFCWALGFDTFFWHFVTLVRTASSSDLLRLFHA